MTENKPIKKFYDFWNNKYSIVEYNGFQNICKIKCNEHNTISFGYYNTSIWKRNGYVMCPMCRIEKNKQKKLNKLKKD